MGELMRQIEEKERVINEQRELEEQFDRQFISDIGAAGEEQKANE